MKNLVTGSLLFFLSAFALSVMAQKHEISIYGGGGISSLNSKNTTIVSPADKSNKAGLQFGVNYGFNFTPRLAILSGTEIASYKSGFEVSNINGSYNTVDSENDEVEFAYAMQGYEETATAMYVNIPVMLRYTHPLGNKTGIYIAGGGKLGFAMKGSYDNSYNDLTTTGTYHQWGMGGKNPVVTDEPDQGFGKMGKGSSDGDIDFKMMYMAAAELGVKHDIGEKYTLYIGGYFDYALNNVYKKDQNLRQIVEYNSHNPAVINKNSVVNSTVGGSKSAFFKSMHPISAGIKIRFSYKL